MGKQHETMPTEPLENPIPAKTPEIIQPNDPGTRPVPHEDDDNVPNELPPRQTPDEEPPYREPGRS
jgi:hypothetical protein